MLFRRHLVGEIVFGFLFLVPMNSVLRMAFIEDFVFVVFAHWREKGLSFWGQPLRNPAATLRGRARKRVTRPERGR
jgi:hypothetical protein